MERCSEISAWEERQKARLDPELTADLTEVNRQIQRDGKGWRQTMVSDPSDIWGRLVRLAEGVATVGLRQLGKKIVLTRQTDLVKDLGLVGDDAAEFMDAYASVFDIEPGGYKFSSYFGPEQLWLLPGFSGCKRKKSIWGCWSWRRKPGLGILCNLNRLGLPATTGAAFDKFTVAESSCLYKRCMWSSDGWGKSKTGPSVCFK